MQPETLLGAFLLQLNCPGTSEDAIQNGTRASIRFRLDLREISSLEGWSGVGAGCPGQG